MSEMLNLPALVIRETDYDENDKLLTLLTAEKGKLTVRVRGGKSLRNKNLASCQLLCYSEFTVKERGGFHTLSEAALIEQFFGLRRDLTRFALAQYAADVAGEVCVENSDESEMLQLLLNTLYMLSETDRPADFVKAVFELRGAALCGFCPALGGCGTCGRPDGEPIYLDVMNGTLRCGDCFDGGNDRPADPGTATVILPLSAPVLRAMRYVTAAPAKRIFSFSLSEEETADFARVTETYLLHQLGHGFRTLDFYHKIRA